MAITTSVICNSFKKELFEGTHNFKQTGGNSFKLSLYTNSAVLGKSTTSFTTDAQVSNSGQYKHIAFYYMDINDDNFKEGDNRIKPINISDQVALATGYKYEAKSKSVAITLNQDNPAPLVVTQLSQILFDDYHAINHCQL